MNSKRYVHLTSLIVASAGAVLAIGDKIIAMPGLPQGLVSAWPLVVFIATLIDRVGSLVVDESNKVWATRDRGKQ